MQSIERIGAPSPRELSATDGYVGTMRDFLAKPRVARDFQDLKADAQRLRAVGSERDSLHEKAAEAELDAGRKARQHEEHRHNRLSFGVGIFLATLFVTLDALPQTPSGKTDRLRLPAIDATRPDSATPFTPPGSPHEAALLSIWIEALGITWLGVHDNFFEVGGDSLAALRIVAQIKAALGVELPLADLFNGPTVAATASVIARLQS